MPTVAFSVNIQPLQKGSDARASQGYCAISRSVINVDCVTVRVHGVPAREYDIIDIAMAFILGLRTENPLVSAKQALGWLLKIK
jgi:hypothetical protein